jgi:hypothetical protein
MLDICGFLCTDFGHLNRGKLDVIMTKIRLVSSGGCNEVVVERFGGVA